MRAIHLSNQIHDEGLMHRAAFAIAVRITMILRATHGRVVGSRVLLLVGGGNNGGDALLAGQILAQRGVDVRALYLTDRDVSIRAIQPDDVEHFNPDVVLDGLFGIGLRSELSQRAVQLIAATRNHGLMVAVDIPSGVHADTGLVEDGCVQADITLTVGTLKPGLLTGFGKQASGIVDVLDMDFPYPASRINAVDLADVAKVFGPPMLAAHKYSRGVVLVNAGSEAYRGAAVLAVAGARASGVGLVHYSGGAADNVVQAFPDVIVRTQVDVNELPGDHTKDDNWDEHAQTRAKQQSGNFKRVDAILLGSGDAGDISTLGRYLEQPVPVVIDAGALDYLLDESIQQSLKLRLQSNQITVITPHVGEARRLGVVASDRLAWAERLAQTFSVTVVLKGPGTVICDPAGIKMIDTFGTSALATAGTGDVLAGLIAGTLAQPSQVIPAIERIACAVALQGLAGRLAGNGCTAVTLSQMLTKVRNDLADTQE